jgi:uncharacterized SAM-binding protein YcdF (DUF218 family)
MLIVAKLVGKLLNPALWLVVMLLGTVMARTHRTRRRLTVAALFTALFFSNGWVVQNAIAWYQSQPEPMQAGERYEACILLSGLAGFDEKDSRGYFTASSDRFIQAMRLYKLGHVRRIILTGGQGNPFSRHNLRESDFLMQSLLEMGVPASDIVNERDARNTIENAVNTRRTLDSLGIRGRSVLVTSAVHMPRALRTFRSEGLDVRPFPCDFGVKPSGSSFTWQSLLPTPEGFGQWDRLLKEMVGTAFLILKGR